MVKLFLLLEKKDMSARCFIPEIWCGEGRRPKGYSKKGTSYECMKKGFGAGSKIERLLNLPKTSLQTIRYVGPKHEESLSGVGIKTLTTLKSRANKMTPNGFGKLLSSSLIKSDGNIDGRAYNSIINWLFENGIKNLPKCVDL